MFPYVRLTSFVLATLVASSLLNADERFDSTGQRPNVLFLAIDDLNDWCGPLGGHPLAHTPNMERLSSRGTTFTNAHCNAPLCNPSRTSLLIGLRPTTTGIYGLSPSFRDLPEFAQRITLPQHFARHGYHTGGVGKIFHPGVNSRTLKRSSISNATTIEAATLADFTLMGAAGGIGVRPKAKLIGPTPMGNHPAMDWGSFPHDDTDKGDYQVASWAIEQIRKADRDKPFFIAAGFFLPHVPCYVTEKWLERYPNDASVLPQVLAEDRQDTPRFSWYLHWQLPEPRCSWLQENDQWIHLVRSYFAATSFVDAQIGRVLNALDESGLAEDTIVVLWSDHGWHLGEKGITGKNSLWEEATRVPLIFAGPGVAKGACCDQPVELLDLYPTLIDLCQLPAVDQLEGLSLTPQLRHSEEPRARPAITSHNQGNHGVRSQRYRFIRYADGSEEFYDHQTDPHEWHNLAGREEYATVIAEHRRWLPSVDRPPAPGSQHRVLTYDPTADTATWEGTSIRRDSAIPE